MKLFYLGLLLLLASVSVHCSPLHDAAVAGDVDLVKQLLDSKKYDVNGKDAQGRTPLAAAMAACGQDVPDQFLKSVPNGELMYCKGGVDPLVANFLVCAGADVNVDVYPQEHPGYKLIHQAVCNQDGVLYTLLVAGADPNTPYKLPGSKKTVTPLTWGAMCVAGLGNFSSTGAFMFSTLVTAGANPLPDGPSNPPSALLHPKAHPLSKCNKLEACTTEEVKKGILMRSGFPANFNFIQWETLWEAQEKAHASPTGTPNQPDQKKGVERSCATAKEEYERLLDTRMTEAKKKDYQAKYPLHVAVAANNLTAVQQIVESGKAKINEKDDKGLTPLQVALSCTKPVISCWPDADSDIAAYLVSKGANVKLDISPRITQPQGPGYTLLHWASSLGLTITVEALIKGGADVNALWFRSYTPLPGGKNNTPLTLAAACDSRMSTHDNPGPQSTNSTIKALLDAGANPLIFGKDRPLTSDFGFGWDATPAGAIKCAKIGACTESEVESVIKTFPIGACPQSYLLAWKAQDKLVGAAAANKGSMRLKVADKE